MPTPHTPAVRRALIVHAHPEPASFSSAQATAVAEQLRAHDVDVHRIDLYAEGWDPVLAREQYVEGPGHFKPQAEQLRAVVEGTLDEAVAAHLRQVQQADLLVLSFPLWWFSMPAVLKGWVDRVFVTGAAFGGGHGIFEQGGLQGKRAVLSLTTGGARTAFAPGAPEGYGDIDTFLFHIHRGMLEFVGYEVLPPVITYAPARLDEAGRAAALVQARAHTTGLLRGRRQGATPPDPEDVRPRRPAGGTVRR